MDDHPDVRLILVYFLTGLGHWVESSCHAGAALERLRQNGFDVLLTDLWLPTEHGWDFLRELRARGKMPAYVVSVGAVHRQEAVQLSRAAGCCAHLEQPLRLSEVEAVLEAVCTSKMKAATQGQQTDACLPITRAGARSVFRPEAQELIIENRRLRVEAAQGVRMVAKAIGEMQRQLLLAGVKLRAA